MGGELLPTLPYNPRTVIPPDGRRWKEKNIQQGRREAQKIPLMQQIHRSLAICYATMDGRVLGDGKVYGGALRGVPELRTIGQPGKGKSRGRGVYEELIENYTARQKGKRRCSVRGENMFLSTEVRDGRRALCIGNYAVLRQGYYVRVTGKSELRMQ